MVNKKYYNDLAAIHHNSYYRGKNLGTITASNIDTFLSTHEVSSGKFTDIYVGDRITIQDGTYNKVWVVAGLDTEYNRGYSALSTHHISLIPETYLFNGRMNSTNTTEGGYINSEMHTVTLPTIVTNLKKALGTHLLERSVLLTNSISNNISSGAGSGYTGSSNNYTYTNTYATIMSEVQVYGSIIWSSSGYDIGEACQQLPIFKFINHVRNGRYYFWLRGISCSTNYTIAGNHGFAGETAASRSDFGIRPLIVIG